MRACLAVVAVLVLLPLVIAIPTNPTTGVAVVRPRRKWYHALRCFSCVRAHPEERHHPAPVPAPVVPYVEQPEPVSNPPQETVAYKEETEQCLEEIKEVTVIEQVKEEIHEEKVVEIKEQHVEEICEKVGDEEKCEEEKDEEKCEEKCEEKSEKCEEKCEEKREERREEKCDEKCEEKYEEKREVKFEEKCEKDCKEKCEKDCKEEDCEESECSCCNESSSSGPYSSEESSEVSGESCDSDDCRRYEAPPFVPYDLADHRRPERRFGAIVSYPNRKPRIEHECHHSHCEERNKSHRDERNKRY